MKRMKAPPFHRSAENQLKKTKRVTNSFPTDNQKLVHELQVHQIELEMQNEELRHTQDQLEAALEKYNDFYDFAPLGYFIFDRQGTICELNLTSANIFGKVRSNLLTRKFQQFISPETHHVFLSSLQKAFEENIKTSCEVMIPNPCEQTACIYLQCSASIDGEKCLAVMLDITGNRKTEQELHESREKLNLALENGNVGVWEWNLTTDEMIWDERMEKMFGLEPGTFGKTSQAFEDFLVEEDIYHVQAAIRKALDEKIPFETIYRIRLNNGEIKYFSAKASVNTANEAKAIKMSGVCFDITEMKKGAEQALFKLNEDLLRSNKELEQFAYVASHDLREPLRMVSSFTQLLAQRYQSQLDNDGKEFIQYAVDGAMRMQELIDDLLAYSRIKTRGEPFSLVNLNKILELVINNLSLTVQEKNAHITSDELPSIIADEAQMSQLFQNLIGNALKFCIIEPRIHISSKEENDYYIFSVHDNGIGIEPQHFKRIFQIFQRLQLRAEYAGTGIGLAICKNIVERHRGKLWLESQLGEGTTFYFSIIK